MFVLDIKKKTESRKSTRRYTICCSEKCFECCESRADLLTNGTVIIQCSQQKITNKRNVNTVGSRSAMVHSPMIHVYDPCPVGPSTPDLWCITVATQASFLYLVRF